MSEGLTYQMTNFDAFMDAVTEAYGPDIWNTISTNAKLHSSEFADMITAVDGVDAVYLKNGDVAYYTYNKSFVGNAATVENAVNSNASAGRVLTEVRQPAELSVEAQTGEVVATSGMKTVSGGAKVAATMGKVATGVAAVATGVQLGAIIDSALYNADPEFWNSHGMSALNPQTWDSICTTQEGKDCFNFVFGINKDTGTTQAYIDEDAFAYIAAYLASKGVYNTESGKQIDDETVLRNPPYSMPIPFIDVNDLTYVNHQTSGGMPLDYTFTYSTTVGTCVVCPYVYNNNMTLIALSTQPFTARRAMHNSQSGTTSYTNFNGVQGGTYQGLTVYYNTLQTFPLGSTFEYNGEIWSSAKPIFPNDNYWDLLYIYENGYDVQSGGVEGITAQEDATLPTGITPTMTIPEVLSYLQTTYPDLWDDAISNDVIQPDGSIKTYTYVPTGLPDNIPVDQITGQLQPTGGVDMIQGQLPVTPTSPQNIQGSLLNIATTQSAYNPHADLDNPNTPDTGEGNTPPVVIPTGSVDALYSIYNPTQAQVNSFGAWLWSPDFVDQLKKLFNDPMQSIIGLHKVFATPATSGTGTIHVGYLDSEVGSKLVSDQYTEVDCGSISLYEYFGNALDYLNTDIYLYLPFVGIVPLNVDDVMRATIGVKYKVDVLTGACLAVVNVSRDGAGGQLYTYSGNCAVQYPLSSGSYMGIVASIAGIAGAVVGTIATGGAMLPVAIGAGASALSGAKTKVEHSGSLSGNAGAMGIKKPYLIIRRPQTAIADNFDVFKGVSNNEFVSLGSCSGYTQIRYVNLENFAGATKEEIYEIENLLESGIII